MLKHTLNEHLYGSMLRKLGDQRGYHLPRFTKRGYKRARGKHSAAPGKYKMGYYHPKHRVPDPDHHNKHKERVVIRVQKRAREYTRKRKRDYERNLREFGFREAG